jgi:hypothetical protein
MVPKVSAVDEKVNVVDPNVVPYGKINCKASVLAEVAT